jgi:hypothetical protein
LVDCAQNPTARRAYHIIFKRLVREGRNVRQCALEVCERSCHQIRRKDLERSCETDKERVCIETLGKKSILVLNEQLLTNMAGWLLISITNPEQTIIKHWNARQMIENWVILTTIADDDPDASTAGILEDRAEQFGMLLHIFLSIHEDEACPLTMKIEDSLIRDIGFLQKLRRSEIIYSRKHPEHRARPGHKQVEICRQDPIHVSCLHEESDAKVSPIDLGFVNVLSYEVTAFA